MPHDGDGRRGRSTLAEELGLLDRRVFFNEGWVPYDERGAYLLEADVGVSAHFDELEARFAFRTRLLDCIWAGLPIVTSRGDALAEVVEERGLGRAVPPGDVDAYAEALDDVLDRDRASLRSELRRRPAGVRVARRRSRRWPRSWREPPTLARRACPDAPGRGVRRSSGAGSRWPSTAPADWRSEARPAARRRLAGDRAAHPPGARPEAAAGKEPPTQPLP